MSGIVVFLVAIAFTWFIASVYYQFAIRPFACDSVRFAVFRLRDELRQLAIVGEVDATSFPYQHLEEMLNTMSRACRWYGISNIIEYHWVHGDTPSNPDIVRFDAEASPRLKDIDSKALQQMLRVMAYNSPGWMIAGSLILMASWMEALNRLLWHTEPVIEPGFAPLVSK